MLLERVGIVATVRPIKVDEDPVEGEAAEDYVRRVVRRKLDAALEAAKGEAAFVMTGDTAVVVDDVVLGKPASPRENAEMLSALSGRAHLVLSAVALGREGRVLGVRSAQTKVVFRRVTAAEADRYVATGEGADKAGGYALQGLAGGFVERIDGAYGTVVGLPIMETLELLRAHGVVQAWP